MTTEPKAQHAKEPEPKAPEHKEPERALLGGTPICPKCGEILALPSPAPPSQAGQFTAVRCQNCLWVGVARRAREDKE